VLDRGYALCRLPRIHISGTSSYSVKAKFGKGHRTGPLARIEVLGLLHAVLERKAGEGFFCRVAAQPCPLFFGDPESSFYPRFPLRRPREEVLRFHHVILAQGAQSPGPRVGSPVGTIVAL
jgi:hypothetical protein